MSNSCNHMNCRRPGFSVRHYLPEFAQTHVLWIGDVIQPSNPLSPPSPPALNLFQHQSLFQGCLFTFCGQRIGASASALPVNVQGWISFRIYGIVGANHRPWSQNAQVLPSSYEVLCISTSINDSTFFKGDDRITKGNISETLAAIRHSTKIS